MVNALEEFSEPLLQLYSGLGSAEPWAPFLQAMRDRYAAAYATIILTPPHAIRPGIIVTPDVDQAEIAAAIEFFASDPFTGLPEGQVVSARTFVGEAAYRESPFYRDYLIAYGVGDILGLDLMAASGFQMRLRVCKSEACPDFTAEDHDWCARFVPHLRAALSLYEKFEAQRGEDDVYARAIEQLSLGALLLDRDGNIRRCNIVARTILAERDGIFDEAGRLLLGDPKQQEALRRMLEDNQAETLAFLRIARPSGRRDIGIVMRRIGDNGLAAPGATPVIALFLTDPARQPGITGKAISDIFDLTPTEAEIAACLANGLSLGQAAPILGITLNTARGHLRSVFAKTDIGRQSQLVHRIRTSVTGLISGS